MWCVSGMMASLGISSDTSDTSDSDGASVNEPEPVSDPDPPPGPVTSGQVGQPKTAGDSEWDSTVASDVNTPRGVVAKGDVSTLGGAVAKGDVSTPRDVEEIQRDESPAKTQVVYDGDVISCCGS